jgi:hypothetical protein
MSEEVSMNVIQRRVLRAFVEGGGDLAEPAQVDRLVRHVEAIVLLLPPKVRTALEVGWGEAQRLDYDALATELSTREGTCVTNIAARQRVSRGLRTLEGSISRRSWIAGSESVGISKGARGL